MFAAPTLYDAFLHQVECQPDAVALVDRSPDPSTRSFSWRQLGAIVACFATEFRDRLTADPGLPRRIGYASDNSWVDVGIALASMSLGTIEVPIDHRLSEKEISERWDRVGGLWLAQADRRRLSELADDVVNRRAGAKPARARLDVDATSLILWTSGTTGAPRGVMLSQRNLAGNAAAKLAAVPQNRDDVRLTVLPLSHAYARTCDLGTWLLSGCTLALSLGFAGLQRLSPEVRPTLINAVPSLADRMLEADPAGLGLDRLQLLGCGGAAIAEATFRAWQARGVTVIQGYGLTETSPVICSATPDNAAPGLVGELVDGWESEIRQGQLFVRGPHTMLGYWNDPMATRARIDDLGWLSTGDLVEQDARSRQLKILGRADDVIVLGNARKVSPSTIEARVEQVAAVRHALLIYRDGLQLWFDAQQDADDQQVQREIKSVLAVIPECHDCAVYRFAPPLSAAAGELTSKGTIRRTRILDNRFTS